MPTNMNFVEKEGEAKQEEYEQGSAIATVVFSEEKNRHYIFEFEFGLNWK